MVILSRPPLTANYPLNGYPPQPGRSTNFSSTPIPAPAFALTPPSGDQLALKPVPSPISNPEGLPQTTHLGNGATASAIFMPNRQQSSLYLMLPLSPELAGSRILLSRMLMNGSDDTRQRIETLRNEGMSLSIHPYLPGTLALTMHGPAGKEREMTRAMLTFLLNPQWTANDFEQTRQNILHHLEDQAKQPETTIRLGLMRTLYGNDQAYSLTPGQQMMVMGQQTPQNMLASLQRLNQSTTNAMISMAAPLATGEQLAILDQTVQEIGWNHNPFTSPLPRVSAAISPTAFQKMAFIPSDTLKRAQIHLCFEVPPPGDRDYPAFLLLKNILAGHTEGSLFERLRTQDGLVYGASVYGGMPLGNQSLYNAAIEVDFDKIRPAANELMAITRQLASQPVGAPTVETAKRKFLLNIRNAEQTASGTLSSNAPWQLYGLAPPSMNELQNAIARLTPTDVQRVAQRVFNTPNNVQLLGISAPTSVLKEQFPNAPLTPVPL
jgi:zinc protease